MSSEIGIFASTLNQVKIQYTMLRKGLKGNSFFLKFRTDQCNTSRLRINCNYYVSFYFIVLYYIDINNILSTKLKHCIPSTYKTSTRLTFLFFYSCTLVLHTIQDDKKYISHQIFSNQTICFLVLIFSICFILSSQQSYLVFVHDYKDRYHYGKYNHK